MITYDDIYELLRAEKNSADLEPLNASYFSKVKEYLAAKRTLLESQKGGMFSGLKERAKILSEIENVRGALKDLFEKRECKVINRALYTLRTELKLKDSTSMLPSEVELYNSLLSNLEKSKLAFTRLIDEGAVQEPTFVETPPVKEPVSEPIPEPVAAPIVDEDGVSLTFLDAVPELVDASLRKHGPFEVGETASLPSELASILVAQGKAKTA